MKNKPAPVTLSEDIPHRVRHRIFLTVGEILNDQGSNFDEALAHAVWEAYKQYGDLTTTGERTANPAKNAISDHFYHCVAAERTERDANG